MKKILFTVFALMLFSLSAHAYNYNNNCPSNTFGGQSLFPTEPKLNGSAQAYQDMVDANNRRNQYSVDNNYYIYPDGSYRKMTLKEQHYAQKQRTRSK